ncbi:MAG: hypothetical protein D6741_18195, partial [Planctomycetota bacterium]
ISPSPNSPSDNPQESDSAPGVTRRDEAVTPTAAVEPVDGTWQPRPNPEQQRTPETVFEPPLVPVDGSAGDLAPIPLDPRGPSSSTDGKTSNATEPHRALRVPADDASLAAFSDVDSLRDDLFGDTLSDIDGDRLSLEECLSQAPSRLMAAQAYWRAAQAKAHYANAVNRSATLATLRAESASRLDLSTVHRIEAAAIEADARLEEARTAYIKAAAALAETIGATAVQRPTNRPLTTPYATRLEALPTALQTDPQILAAQSAVESSFSAVCANAKGVVAADQRVAQTAGRPDQIGAVEQYFELVDRWIDSVIDYNQTVARYANAAVPEDLPPSRYVGVLIGDSR